jgi:hypothetical protein
MFRENESPLSTFTKIGVKHMPIFMAINFNVEEKLGFTPVIYGTFNFTIWQATFEFPMRWNMRGKGT